MVPKIKWNQKTWWYISFSSCVNEAKICQGVPLCPQKEDLKWCKETPLTDWEPFIIDNAMCESILEIEKWGFKNSVWQAYEKIASLRAI